MSTTLATVIGVTSAAGLLAYCICVTDRDEQARARDVRDPRLDTLPPDPAAGLTWDPRWDEEPRPGTGPRRRREEVL